MPYPKQTANVYVEKVDNELCVYDWEQQQMHALNPTAAMVWEQCDGKTGPAQMAARLESELNVPNADKLVTLSLDRLQKAQLLGGTASQAQRTVTRREVLKMAGIGLALLPVVSSIALPSPAEAQSCETNCSFLTSTNSPTDPCLDACIADLFPFETLCYAESAGQQGECECFVYTTDLVGSGCDDSNGLGQNTRSR